MCGICLSVAFLKPNNKQQYHHFKKYQHLAQFLSRRGPDSYNEISDVLDDRFDIFFSSAVLHLRGSRKAVQPVCDEKNIFLWNGEIFDGSLIETKCDSSVSDTNVIAEAMFNAQTVYEVLQVISSIKGPYAFIFYQADGKIWFGRDIFGRRSLLWNFDESVFQLCSVATDIPDAKWQEVPTKGIFCLDLNQSCKKHVFVLQQYAWSSSASGSSLNQKVELPVSSSIAEISLATDINVSIPVSEVLNREVPSDSSSLNLLSLLNELQLSKISKQEVFQIMMDLPIVKETLNNFEIVLSHAIKRRVEEQLNWCKACYVRNCQNNSSSCCDHSYIGVLFSGGLDSIVIACLTDKYVNPQCSIDLINVAFACRKNTRVKTNDLDFDTPDRVTGKNGYEALKSISPNRSWKFVEVNVTDCELKSKRELHISELLHPSCTVLDDSIGCALWFASQGEGFISIDREQIAYKSSARVLLVGMGADEQLAGYSRHRAKFKNTGWEGLIEEIALELDRIGSRNLGRDDRIIADNSVESRYPFLDENVVSFLNSLPIWLKTNLNLDRGIGEKLLLRLLAFKLGLTEAATLPKRAIQFGSRIAKLENHKEKGSDVCTRLLQSSN